MSVSILIVDDSLTVRMDLMEAFEAIGMPATCVSSMGEARAAIARHAFDLVILDVLLPDGDGIDLLREIRAGKDASSTFVILLSTESEVKDRIRGLETGADEYVGKPYDAAYVTGRAKELLASKRAASASAAVLVIDDSPTFRAALKERLERAGYEVLIAPSGEAGLQMAASSHPAAILVDGVLPGIDGTTVIRRIRLDAALRATPCILLTGSETDEAELRALDAGADAFVRKDGDLEHLMLRLATVLRAAPATAQRVHAVSSLSPKKILAVDDSLTYLHALADVLRGEGYDVAVARSGEEALALLAVETVDCILLDLVMPDLGGREVCERIKGSTLFRDIPLIMLTAVEDREAMIGSLIAGADDYISKSSDFEVLRARVRAQLRRKQFEAESRRIREELLHKELETSEARAARELAETKAALVDELERRNRELEAFSYSVSHDLRAPLRGIDGFSQALVEEYESVLDDQAKSYLSRIRANASRMSELIDDLLLLSKVTRVGLVRERVNLTSIARSIAALLAQSEPERNVDVTVQDGLVVSADGPLCRVLLENLIGNAWKFTTGVPDARIEVGAQGEAEPRTFFVRDNGAGFPMEYVDKLFRPFQRLHTEAEFPGTGVGLATVYRIVDRHGGRVDAQSILGHGATFTFTLPAPRKESTRAPSRE